MMSARRVSPPALQNDKRYHEIDATLICRCLAGRLASAFVSAYQVNATPRRFSPLHFSTSCNIRPEGGRRLLGLNYHSAVPRTTMSLPSHRRVTAREFISSIHIAEGDAIIA